ncbi:TIGR03364 family FAD-dependent oxidoreductase [Nocardiopsis coralliicola]
MPSDPHRAPAPAIPARRSPALVERLPMSTQPRTAAPARSAPSGADRSVDVAVVGAGIVGLAHALAAASAGLRVALFERDERAVGASVRNFGLVWPVGQPAGLYDRALRSRDVWLEVAERTGIWHRASGSLLVVRTPEEEAVAEEYLATSPHAVERGARMLAPGETVAASPVLRTEGVRGALWSPTEVNVDPRTAIPALAGLLAEEGVQLRFGTAVTGIDRPRVDTTEGPWRADHVFVCSGNEFQALFPEVFDRSGVRRCKLQMMRTTAQPEGWELGPALCAGLTLLHYGAYAHCTALGALRERFDRELPLHRAEGVHVLVSATAGGQVTLGDSHAYGLTHDPFERDEVDRAVLDYFAGFAALPRPEIAERWHGVYPSLPDGAADLVVEAAPGVTVVNGLGGAGMTLSFGLAQETTAALV